MKIFVRCGAIIIAMMMGAMALLYSAKSGEAATAVAVMGAAFSYALIYLSDKL